MKIIVSDRADNDLMIGVLRILHGSRAIDVEFRR
jgi:hypothetical protein